MFNFLVTQSLRNRMFVLAIAAVMIVCFNMVASLGFGSAGRRSMSAFMP